MEHGGNILKIGRDNGINHFQLDDFSANISPLGIPEGLKTILADTLQTMSVYPDPEYLELRSAIARYAGVNKDRIIPGNGAAQIIHDAIRFLKPIKAMLMAPTFSEYEAALRTTNSQIDYFYTCSEQLFSLNEMDLIRSLDESFDLLVLCNPNNPTGSLLPREVVLKILKHCREIGCQVIIDEAFMDFVEKEGTYSMLSFVTQWDNLMIVRAFTKIFAIPGLRLGYGVYGCLDKAKNHGDKMIPWSINAYADAMKSFINKKEAKEYVGKVKNIIHYERNRIFHEIEKMQYFFVFPSVVNFLLVRIESNDRMSVKKLWEQLLKDHILIRDCSNFRGLPKDCFRIAIKNKEENQRLIDSLKKAHETI